jgi:hypothetical protein
MSSLENTSRYGMILRNIMPLMSIYIGTHKESGFRGNQKLVIASPKDPSAVLHQVAGRRSFPLAQESQIPESG